MNLWLTFGVQAAASFVATCGFGVIYNIPFKSLIHGGFIGMAAWLIYFFLYEWVGNTFGATFVAAFAIAVASHVCARLFRQPVIIYSVSGIIPLVPGGLTYSVMNQAAHDQYSLALHLGEKAFVLSGAIALGLMLAEVLHPLIKKATQHLPHAAVPVAHVALKNKPQ
ncbi:MAG: threonine/serine exporter family protein [Sporolactobacillus sp.]